MAADLSVLPSTGIVSQLCGDAHVRNLGAYAAPDGRLVFDINDFDETIRGPFEWDLKRMAASVMLAGRASGHKESSARQAVEICMERYADQMHAFARMPGIEVNRYQVHRLGQVAPVHKALMKAERSTPQHTLEQLTQACLQQARRAPPLQGSQTFAHPRNRQRRPGPFWLRSPPYREMLQPERQHLLSFYRPVDVAFKVVGTGSVGLRDYCVYFEGNGPDDPLFLQIKEEPASAYAPYLPDAHPAPHNGQRAAEGQRAMQLQSDPFLGWTHIGARQYLVRQLNDHKGSIDLEDLAGGGLEAYAEVCGELLARGHARSGDPLVIAGYLGSGDGFAEALSQVRRPLRRPDREGLGRTAPLPHSRNNVQNQGQVVIRVSKPALCCIPKPALYQGRNSDSFASGHYFRQLWIKAVLQTALYQGSTSQVAEKMP